MASKDTVHDDMAPLDMSDQDDQRDSPRATAPTPDSAAPVVRRLGLRLGHLYQWAMAAGPFDDIWDLCCDHGRLGLHLHQSQREQAASYRSHVHLIDQTPHSIAALQAKYAVLMDAHLTIACMDAGDIALLRPGRQLVVIAGVGGGTVTSIMAKLCRQLEAAALPHAPTDIEFMLSPNLNTVELRSFLRHHRFELIAEEFVTEKSWSHEHLHVRYPTHGSQHSGVTAVGASIWQPMTAAKHRYLTKQLNHYQKRVQLSGHVDVQHAANAYKNLLQSLPQS